MSEKRKIYKPKAISGFPEWLPEWRAVEQRWLDHIRATFESYGFCSIETPSVEEIDVLLAKGEVDKEIYVLERLHKEDDDSKDARLALHFDQTVPLARYVAQHFNDLTFPFKRYQMQRVWRGERPQMGRMREFTQCDIDVINVDHLPIHFDAEIPAMIYDTLDGLDIGRIQHRISNRKILIGMLNALGVSNDKDIVSITRTIDKIEKEKQTELITTLISILKSALDINADEAHKQAEFILEFAKIKAIPKDFSGLLRDFIARNDVIARSVSDAAIQTINEGIEELSFVLDYLSYLPDHAVAGDLSIVRGLDYYTGTVYETQLLDVPEFTGSVCSGGRYDDLAGSFINKHLPGVGISIGFSRLFDVLKQTGHLKPAAKGPADILMALPSEEKRSEAAATARTLRERGFKVEMYHAPQKIGKQLSYAEKKGIPFVWFPPFEDGKAHEIKDMNEGTQEQADPADWSKP